MWLSLSWMVATHGLAHAPGFALCGLAGWHRLAAAPSAPGGRGRETASVSAPDGDGG